MTTAADQPPKTWTAGTLTYTASALVTLCCLLLLGDFAAALKDRSISPITQLILKKYEVSNYFLAVFVVSLPNLITVFYGPVIACKSDSFRSRYGRRLPFLLIGTPICAAAMVGMAFSPRLGELLHSLFPHFGLTAVSLMILAFFWILYQFAAITVSNMFSGLINDVVPHSVIGRFFGFYRMVSLAAGFGFSFFILGLVSEFYYVILTAIAVIYVVIFLFMCFKVKEGEYPPPPAAAGPGRLQGIWLFCRNCYTDSYYLLMFLFLNLSAMTLNSFGVFALYYSMQMGVSNDHYGKAGGIMLLISFGLSYLQGMLVDRFHPLRMVLLALFLYGGATIAGAFLIRGEWSFLIVYVLQGVLAGFHGTTSAPLAMRLMPREIFGQLNAAAASIISLTIVIYIPLLGKLIDLTGRNYSYSLLACGVLAMLSVICGLCLYVRFKKYGGVNGYVAPLPRLMRQQP